MKYETIIKEIKNNYIRITLAAERITLKIPPCEKEAIREYEELIYRLNQYVRETYVDLEGISLRGKICNLTPNSLFLKSNKTGIKIKLSDIPQLEEIPLFNREVVDK